MLQVQREEESLKVRVKILGRVIVRVPRETLKGRQVWKTMDARSEATTRMVVW